MFQVQIDQGYETADGRAPVRTWGGRLARGWQPAITGTLNQTGTDDAAASSVATRREAERLVRLCVGQGAPRRALRVVTL